MKLENLTYSLFGNNLVIGKHIKKQLSFLKIILPAELRYREMDDLGCGDGKVTVLLKEIFQPLKLRAFDINQSLVRRAGSNGIDTSTIDLNKAVPSGELAVMWGVLHHLQNPESCLHRLKDNYPLVFIREPVKTGIINGMELGHPMRLQELISLFNNIFPDIHIHYCDNSVLAFYACPDYLEKERYNLLWPAPLSFPEPSLAGRY